jgi:hypothetical protein
MCAVGSDMSTLELYHVAEGLQVGHALMLWDPKASKDALRKLTEICLKMSERWKRDPAYLYLLAGEFGTLMVDRYQLEDADEAAYAKFAAGIDLQEHVSTMLFKPLWECDPASPLAKVAKAKLESGYGSVASSDPAAALSDSNRLINYHSDTFLLLSSAYRNLVARAIENDGWAGFAWVEKSPTGVYVRYTLSSGGSGSSGVPKGLDPGSGEKVEIGVGDVAASRIAFLKTCPAFVLTWTTDKRKAARAQIAAWLRDDQVDWRAVVSRP